MSDQIAEEKKQIRKQCRQIRKELNETFRRQTSQKIDQLITNWQIFKVSQIILSYMPIKAEVDLRSLLERYPEKTWVLPRILPDIEGGMIFHVYDPHRLVRHPFGMDEPAQNLPVVAPQNIQLALIPGLAYDRSGWRLGYGGGYYDRFLRGFEGVSLGVVFDSLFLAYLPHGEFDVPVKWVVTESGLCEQPVDRPDLTSS